MYSRRSRPLGRAVGQSLLAIQTDQPPNAQSVAPPRHFQSSSTHRQVRSDSRYRLQSPECLWIVDLRVLSQLQLDHPNLFVQMLGERLVGSHRTQHALVGEADAIGVIRQRLLRCRDVVLCEHDSDVCDGVPMQTSEYARLGKRCCTTTCGALMTLLQC